MADSAIKISVPARPKVTVAPYPVDPAVLAGVVHSGEAVYLTANYGIGSLSSPGTNNANAAKFAGVSVGETIQTMAPGFTSLAPKINVYREKQGACRFKTTVGETYHTGDAVYIGADGRTITSVSTNAGRSIGTVAPDQREPSMPAIDTTVLGTYVVGAATQEILILIDPAI